MRISHACNEQVSWKKVGPLEFETERLHLRQWIPDPVPFAALNADPKVMEFFPATLDRAASDAMADRCQSLIAERGWGFWAAEAKETGQFIGFVGLHIPIATQPFSPPADNWSVAAHTNCPS